MAEKSERTRQEEKVLQFWRENKIFEKTLEKRAPKGDFVFYEGPPTANGMPAIHHLEARAFKDAIPRYRTMRGYRVLRRAGWDTHGLPVELEVEKTLGLKSKKEIEIYGIAEFNRKCKMSVAKYIDDWARFTNRIGYWVNLDDAYFTYNNGYIETVWSILAHVEKRKLLYKDYKVVPWCPRCGTALSSHELAQGYKDIKDLSVYVKFQSKTEDDVYFLVWTTTPWTLPGNVALVVGGNIDYVKIKVEKEYLILAESRLSVIDLEYEIVERYKGIDLKGLSYEPLYTYLPENLRNSYSNKLYKVYVADFVNTNDGTGIVHTAVMYGQEDFELGTKEELPKYHLVDESGVFTSETGFLSGCFVRDDKTTVEIIKDLAHRRNLFKKEKHTHPYPHCWRCKTPLIYYARDSWYIRMSDLRDKLVKENKKITWEPEHIKAGRFGEWLKEVKDWAISRERYWGTPLPIWQSQNGKRMVIDSIESLKKYSQTSSNRYFLMRHGEAENNVKRVVNNTESQLYHLTNLGIEQVKNTASKLLSEKIDLIVASPLLRTRETVEILAKILKIDSLSIIYDDRLREFDAGDFEGRSEDELHAYFKSHDLFVERSPNGEGFRDVRRRLGSLLEEIDQKYSRKKILIITHKICAWLLVVVARRLSNQEAENLSMYVKNAEVIHLDTPILPHNEDFELDLHRPYIDNIVLVKNGEKYIRVKEVLDVWFDSGAMPFASFQSVKDRQYPADFIAEAIDQTRGWFYTLHAIGVLMGKGLAYKNVICLGHLLDKEGKKMSKSVGNVVDPWEEIEKHGADALRFWMYSVNQPGESKNFDTLAIEGIGRKVFNILENIYTFYDLYRERGKESTFKSHQSKHLLDRWIIARFDELVKISTSKLDTYKLLEPARAIKEFVDDLSNWYLRRSRERIKNGDQEAKATLYFVLKELSKVIAPFTPFMAEDLYQKLRLDTDPESVHLEHWPKVRKVDEVLIENMNKIRNIVSGVLEARSQANIKVRQPLRTLVIKNIDWESDYLDLIKAEVNVKEIIEDKNLENKIYLDTHLTPELIEAGQLRDLIRLIQDKRKEKGLRPDERMHYLVSKKDQELFKKYSGEIKQATNVDFD